MGTEPVEEKNTPREKIATYVTTLAIAGTIVLGIFALVYVLRIPDADTDKNLDKKLQVITYVFTALLPLWGTWMGTIMAFYFSKENFMAANESVKNLVAQITPSQKLESTKCKDVMIPYDKIKPFQVSSPAPIEDSAATEAADTATAATEAYAAAKSAADNAITESAATLKTLEEAKQTKQTAEDRLAQTTDPSERVTAEGAVGSAADALAAAQKASDAANERAQTTAQAAQEAMAAKSVAAQAAAEKTAATQNGPTDPITSIKITDALTFMNAEKISRLPLFKDKKLLYIIHQSTFEKFITEVSTSTALNLELDKVTIIDMVNFGSDLVKGYLLNGAQFLGENSNLKQAQELIKNNIYCQDIFITSKGSASEEVMGWVTNTIIADNAKDLQSGSPGS
jgi:chemotaxis protein histidine kinase CheA